MVVASVSVVPHKNLHWFLAVSVQFILALCDKGPEISNHLASGAATPTTLKSGTALAVPVAQEMPPLRNILI